jgi:hypothetical protein
VSPNTSCDEFELRIAVGVLSPLDCFSICLKAVTQILQKFGYFGTSYNEVLPPQFSCQCPRALDGPLQWRLGVAASPRFDQFPQCVDKSGLLLLPRLSASARSSLPVWRQVLWG